MSRFEQIFLQKCRVQDRQEEIYSCLTKLLLKYNEIQKAMEYVQSHKNPFNCFILEILLHSIQGQIEDVRSTMISNKLMKEDVTVLQKTLRELLPPIRPLNDSPPHRNPIIPTLSPTKPFLPLWPSSLLSSVSPLSHHSPFLPTPRPPTPFRSCK